MFREDDYYYLTVMRDALSRLTITDMQSIVKSLSDLKRRVG